MHIGYACSYFLFVHFRLFPVFKFGLAHYASEPFNSLRVQLVFFSECIRTIRSFVYTHSLLGQCIFKYFRSR